MVVAYGTMWASRVGYGSDIMTCDVLHKTACAVPNGHIPWSSSSHCPVRDKAKWITSSPPYGSSYRHILPNQTNIVKNHMPALLAQ